MAATRILNNAIEENSEERPELTKAAHIQRGMTMFEINLSNVLRMGLQTMQFYPDLQLEAAEDISDSPTTQANKEQLQKAINEESEEIWNNSAKLCHQVYKAVMDEIFEDTKTKYRELVTQWRKEEKRGRTKAALDKMLRTRRLMFEDPPTPEGVYSKKTSFPDWDIDMGKSKNGRTRQKIPREPTINQDANTSSNSHKTSRRSLPRGHGERRRQ